MRFLDLAMAGMIGVATIAGLALWTPAQSEAATKNSRLDGRILAALFSFVDHSGIAWLQSTPAAEVCSSVASLSNATFSFSAKVDGEACPGTGVSLGNPVTLEVPLEGRDLVLEGWPNITP